MSEKAAKPPKYSDEEVATLKAGYNPDAPQEVRKQQVEALAAELKRNSRAIIAKLVSLGLYRKAEYVRKDGEKPETRDTTADAIGSILRLSEPDTASLTKANRKALQSIMAALASSVPVPVMTPEEEEQAHQHARSIAAACGIENAAMLRVLPLDVSSRIAETLASLTEEFDSACMEAENA